MRILSILGALFVLSFVGCASVKHYEGPTRPNNEIAIILQGNSYSSRGPRSGLFFLGKISSDGSAKIESMGSRSEVLPGVVTFGFTVEYLAPVFGKQLRQGILKFNAEAGKTYVVDGWSGEKPGAWVLDVDTGSVVARRGYVPDQIIEKSKGTLHVYRRR